MNVHKNARLTPHSRADLVRRVEAGQPPAAVGAAFGVSMRTVRKWVERFRNKGPLEGPLVAASPAAQPDPGDGRRRSGAAAPTALHRQADRG